MTRCAIHVPSRGYSGAGQCAKKHGIRKVKVGDTEVAACAHHRAMIGRGGVVARVVGSRV